MTDTAHVSLQILLQLDTLVKAANHGNRIDKRRFRRRIHETVLDLLTDWEKRGAAEAAAVITRHAADMILNGAPKAKS